jgi:TRAP-type C4-dicarboxylate transport system substrate-binding protein
MKRPVLAAAAAIAGAVALALAPEADGQATYTLNVGSLAPTHSVWWEMLKQIERNLETESGGRIDLIIRPPGTMGEIEMVREVRRGERLQACGVTTAAIAEGGNAPALQVVELPYLFESYAEADHILDNVLWGPVSDLLARRGFVLGAWSENGMRSFASKGKPIRTVADLRGMKMRSQESAVHLAMYQAYGAEAVQKPMTETLTALQSGVVEGLDNAPLFMNLGGLSSALEYYTPTEHIYQPAAVIYSKRWFDELPEDLQGMLRRQRSVATSARTRIREENAAFQELLAEELQVVPVEPAALEEFKRIGRSMHTQFASTVEGGPELLTAIQGELARRRGQ